MRPLPSLCRFALAVALGFLGWSSIQAAPSLALEVGTGQEAYRIEQHLQYQATSFSAPAPDWSPGAWQALPSVDWANPTQEIIWLKLKLKNVSPLPIHLLSNLTGSYITLFEAREQRLTRIAQTGTLVPAQERWDQGRFRAFYVLPHDLAMGEEKTYLWKIRRGEITPFVPDIVQPLQLVKSEWLEGVFAERHGWDMALMGMIFALLFYHLVLFKISKKKYDILFVFNCLGALLLQAHFKGFTFMLFFPDQPALAFGLVAVLSVSLWNLGYMAFSHALLNSKRYLPLYAKILHPGGITLLIAISFSALVYQQQYMLAAITQITVLLSFLTLGIIAIKNRTPNASLYMLANSAYFLGFALSISLFMLTKEEAHNPAPLRELGIMLQLLLFSAALALNFKRIQNKKGEAQALMIESNRKIVSITREYSDTLEAEVSLRTQELQQANETKNKFFSIIAHDLRGPIGSLSVLFNDVIHTGQELEPEILEHIKKSTSTAHQLLENLLTWAKTQQGEVAPHPLHFSIEEPIQETIDLLQTPIQQKDLRLSLDLAPHLYALADQRMIYTVIRNLVNNAIKFTPRGRGITIRTKRRGNWLEVLVEDQGRGISKEDLAQLFEIGNQRSTLGTDGEQGTGLGLILCKEFVEINQGEIQVFSKLGEGSRFIFTIPLGQAPSKEELAAAWKAKLAKGRLLLVEDNALHATTSVKVLEHWVKEYKIAHDGQEALNLLAQESFDLVLIDIDMPNMNGIDATKKAQALFEQLPPFIALSSYSEEEVKEQEGDLFDAYLNKPIKDGEFLLALKSLPQ